MWQTPVNLHNELQVPGELVQDGGKAYMQWEACNG